MAEFNGDVPTYKIVPGISRVSHAGRITKKINFSKGPASIYERKRIPIVRVIDSVNERIGRGYLC